MSASDGLDSLTDTEMERAVLGAIVLDNAALVVAKEVLQPADFYVPGHALVFDAMLALSAKQHPIDALTLSTELRARKRLNTVGGLEFLSALTDQAAPLAHIEAYARTVRDLSRTRKTAAACREAAARLSAGEPLEAIRPLLEPALRASSPDPAHVVGQLFDPLAEKLLARSRGEEQPLRTPWGPLNDALMGGLWPGMYVLVGGTGTGKTQWAIQVAVAAARANQRVLYLALELGPLDLAVRVLATLSGEVWSELWRGRRSEAELLMLLGRHEREMKALPLHLETALPYGYSAEALNARAWALRPNLVVLDYLQLCAGRMGEEPRVAIGRIAYIARAIARDLGAIVLVLSSTSRSNYADLVVDTTRDPSEFVGISKESGEIEYAADGVLAIARLKDGPATDRALLIAKHRHGPLGRVTLQWSGTTFTGQEGEGPKIRL